MGGKEQLWRADNGGRGGRQDHLQVVEVPGQGRRFTSLLRRRSG